MTHYGTADHIAAYVGLVVAALIPVLMAAILKGRI